MYREHAESKVTLLRAGPSDSPQGCEGCPRRGWYLPLKAVLDWIIALILFLAVAPLMVVLAALVLLTSRGPAFYSQSRVGRNGRIFLMYKLRTMRHECEAATGPIWSPPNDSRVTPIGRLLRKTHLDEIPQLLNVLQGRMSLIGPRPERPELCALIEQTIPRFRERLQLRPGMTGLAQTRLPADVVLHTVHKKLAYDLYYVREVNPGLDLRIALSTVLYLIGVVFHSLGHLLLNSHGMAVDPNSETGAVIDEEEAQTPST